MRETVLSKSFTTQSDPKPAAIRPGPGSDAHLVYEPVRAGIDRASRVGVDLRECVGGTGAADEEYDDRDQRRDQHAGNQRRSRPASPAVDLRAASAPPCRRGSVGLRVVPHRRELERRIVRQDRSFELAEVAPGFDAGLLDEQRSSFAIAVERLGLAPGAVEGEHELCTRTLAQRRFLDPVLELRNQLQMLTQRKGAVDALLGDEPALLIEPRSSDLRMTLERDVGERIAAPERRAPDRTTAAPRREAARGPPL